MQYDPVKNMLMRIVRRYPVLRRLFFASLDLVLLRQWYVKGQIRKIYARSDTWHFYDAGSGFCQYSDYVLKRYHKASVFALDLKQDYLEDYNTYAGSRFAGRFSWVTADLVTYQPPEKFDLIAAIDILEHIENDRQVLANFFACLKPGGKLIISTPSDKDETARFTAEHVRPGYQETELRSKLAEAGFQIDKFIYSYGYWGNLSWKLAIKAPLKLVSISKLMLILLPIYYLALYWLILIFMLLDVSFKNKSGNGIIVVAVKPLSAFE